MIFFHYLFVLASCLSIAATNAVLAIMTLYLVIKWWKQKAWEAPTKDFYLFFSIYAWKGVTLIANGAFLKIHRVRELWDKLPYWIISKYDIDKKNIEKVLHALFVVNSALIVYAILQKYYNFPYVFQRLLWPGQEGKMIGYFGSPMHYGGYISLVLLICLALAIFYKKSFIAYFPLLLVGLIFSGVRSYFVGVIFAVFAITLLKSWRTLSLTSVIAMVAVYMYSKIFPFFGERLLSIFQKSSFDVRASYWRVSWDTFKENPFFGVGYNEFTIILNEYYQLGKVPQPSHAHNIYLQEMAEGGFIGLLLIVFTLFFFLRKYYLYQSLNYGGLFRALSAGLLACFISVTVAGLTEYNFGTAILWLLLTFMMGLLEAYKRNFEVDITRHQEN